MVGRARVCTETGSHEEFVERGERVAPASCVRGRRFGSVPWAVMHDRQVGICTVRLEPDLEVLDLPSFVPSSHTHVATSRRS